MPEIRLHLKLNSNMPSAMLLVCERLTSLLETLQREGILEDFGFRLPEQGIWIVRLTEEENHA